MMHPYFLASLLVGGAVVVYAAYLVFEQIHEAPFVNGKKKEDRSERSNEKQTVYELPPSDDGELSVFDSEKAVLRQRRRKVDSRLDSQVSSAPTQSEDEQELLETLSYLNAVEQEIERRKKAIAQEEILLRQQEQQIEMRKQYLQSQSTCSSTSVDQLPPTPLDSNIGKTSINSSGSVIGNRIIMAPDQTLISSDKQSESLQALDNDIQLSVDQVKEDPAYMILSQNLALIDEKNNSQRISPSISTEVDVLRDSVLSAEGKLAPPNTNSNPLIRSVLSEASWSEIGSHISETVSSGTHIDLDDMEIIEH